MRKIIETLTDALRYGQTGTAAEFADRCEFPLGSVRNALANLWEQGIADRDLARRRSGRGGKVAWRYRLAGADAENQLDFFGGLNA